MWSFWVIVFSPILWSSMSVIFAGNSVKSKNDGELGNFANNVYTEQERNAIIQFRGRVDDILESDYERKSQFLIRWIRACSLDLNAAEEMLRKAKKWRKDNNIDNLLHETPLESLKHEICQAQGSAYDGSQVMTIYMGDTDIRKLVMAGHRMNMTRRVLQCLERMVNMLRNASETTGKDVGQAIIIINSEGYNIKQHACGKCISLYMDFLIDAQNYYPEYLRLTVIVNAPRIMKPLFELGKPLMTPATKRSMRLFGTNKLEWSAFLLKYIPPENLSRRYGGSGDW